MIDILIFANWRIVWVQDSMIDILIIAIGGLSGFKTAG
jgi:hypothetical protein